MLPPRSTQLSLSSFLLREIHPRSTAAGLRDTQRRSRALPRNFTVGWPFKLQAVEEPTEEARRWAPERAEQGAGASGKGGYRRDQR